VLEATGADTVHAEPLKAAPPQPLGRRDVQARLAIQQPALLQQPVGYEAREPRIRAGAAHREPADDMLSPSGPQAADPVGDLAVSFGLHDMVSSELLQRPPCNLTRGVRADRGCETIHP
jgi:hypothetical protein